MPRYGATAKRGKCAFARRGEAERRRRGVARRGVVLCEAEAAASSEPAGTSAAHSSAVIGGANCVQSRHDTCTVPVPVKNRHRVPVKRHWGEPGSKHRDTHTGHTGAHEHTDHTEEPHNHPNPTGTGYGALPLGP